MSNNVNDEVIEDSPDIAVQKAYVEAIATNWTEDRQTVAMELGCSVLRGVFGEMDELQEKGSYPNVLFDVVIVLWLRSLDPDQVIDLLAYPNKRQAIAAAYAWAKAEGIKYGNAKYIEGVRAIASIVGGIHASIHAIESDGKTEPLRKNDTRQAGKSGLPITRARRPAKALVTS